MRSPRKSFVQTCPACATANRDEARYCRACGTPLPELAPRLPQPRLLPPPSPRPRPWWHGIGVFAIVATFLVLVDLAMDGRVTWSLVGVPAVGFLAGGILILQFFASVDRSDRRALLAGTVLLAAAVVALPVGLALQSTTTRTETFTTDFDPSIRNLNLDVAVDAGRVTVSFTQDATYLVRTEVVHVGGLFSSHFEGDFTLTETTTGDTLALTANARGIPGLFFVGGHYLDISITTNLSVSLALTVTTGNIGVSIPSGVSVRNVAATVTTGDVGLSSVDAQYMNGATLRLMSTTGNVATDLRQDSGPNVTVSVSATSTTGRVAFGFLPGPVVGAEVRTSVTTGRVDFDPGRYEGTSGLLYAPSRAAYDAAFLKFTVQLTTTTGNIQVG